ncbi:MAG: glycoside hydrolase [Actinomycetota bacterium]|nr:glycoside hydrolase [Actinomycetota bacterium]
MHPQLRIARMTAVVLAVAAVLIAVGGAQANVTLTQVSADPFTNTTSQHATEVEPDTFANGSTVVAAFQVGRFFNGGGSDIGFVRSGDGGATWGAPGFLPGMTFSSGAASPFERVSDPSVAYDARHGVWLISSIPLLPTTTVVPTVFVNRSTDGGTTWSNPVSIPPPVSNSVDLDKNWTVCDNTATSPFYGHCYTELDNFGDGDLELMSTSTDGGATWSTPIRTDGNDKGLGGQPVVQPSGTVIVPFESLNGTITAFHSDNGGASWSRGFKAAKTRFHRVAGDLRTSPLPSAEIAADGTVYVAWEDCRFRKNCTANDIVFSTSTDGVNWSDPARVPIDPISSSADHFIPGLAVDRTTSGAATHLALTYYFYPDATCSGGCQLDVGYVSSPDGGAHWSNPTPLAGPMTLGQIAQTSQGPMVGDYISTSFSGGNAATVIAVGKAPTAAAFDEGMYAPAPLPVATLADAPNAASSMGASQVTGVGIGVAIQAIRRD